MSTELIKVTINGKEFQVAKGARLIDVCREQGFNIPSFCYYADLALQASCRMCLVRIEKMPKLQTSCTITCTDGMVVTTQSEEIEKAQRSMLEFLLANHPLDCPVCDRGGECELQELTFDWGNLEERFIERKNAKPEKYLSPMVANDPQRCILCKRCTRVCDEWMGEEAIEAGNRGANTVIGTFGGWLNCSQCGNCIEVCPTGTLLDGTYRHQHRPWELTQTISTCTYCSDGCQMSLGSRGDELVRIVARDRYVNGHNGEFLCVKGRFGHPFVNHEERIRTPLIRYKKGGRLVPATWDEAIRFVAQNIDKTVTEHGNNAVGVLASPRLTNESVYALKKLATEVIETENFAISDAFSLKPFFDNLGGPLATHTDIRNAKTIILIGGEPEELQPLTGKQMRQAVRNGGAKLIIINSVPIRLREQAAQFIHINPGSEDAAVLALAGDANDSLVARKMGIDTGNLASLREAINQTSGEVVIMSAASFAEVDGTFTNSDGLVQRVRKSIDPVHQCLPDWVIAARLAKELGVDFGFERSATAVFREISERVAGYDGIRYPHLKDESKPVQVKHAIGPQRDLSSDFEALRRSVEAMSEARTKITGTPSVGHELFKPGTLISKTPQIQLLDAGNPKPESVFVSPLYQITIGKNVKREPAVA